jgi:4-hydroxybenzoyl-CoA thioesterase/acyl-CoA thioester hydrolase
VEFHNTDAAGIIHFTAYFQFMEEAEHEFLRSRGLSVLMRDPQGPISWPRVATRCDFRGPLKFEDIVEIEVRLARLGEKSVTYSFVFRHEGREVAEGEMTSVCCRLAEYAPPQSIAIPDWIRERLAAD